MTVYYDDLFAGSASTPLTSTTADSGATWSMLTGTSPTLDGNGFIYGAAVGEAWTNASMPATQNFEVQLDLKRISAVSGQYTGVMLLGKNLPSDSADHYDFMYLDGSGFYWGLNGAAQNGLFGSSVLGVGGTVRIKLVLSTASGNTTFAAWYSTNSGSSWTAFGNNLVIPTPAYAPNVSVWVTGTGVSETTGTHLGRLVVQDPAPSTTTITGPSSGSIGVQSAAFTVTLDKAAQYGGLPVTPASSVGTDTFQATSGGGNVSTVTIPAGSMTVTFYLTPGGTAGNRSISITTSPSLTYSGSPIIYDVTSITIPAGSTSVTFFLTPGGTAGNRNISITTSPELTYSGSPITYSAAAVPTSATLSGPTSGIVGVESTAFTVTVNQPASTGGVIVTPASSVGTDTFQAKSGGGNVSNVPEINFGTQGGTISSPASTTLWTFQPTDTTKGPWQMICRDALFGTTHDSLLSIGYNTPAVWNTYGVVTAEPQWHMNFEQDYWNSGTSSYCCEWYVEYENPGATLSFRPYMVSLNRATGASNVQSDIGPTGDPNYGQFMIESNGSALLTVTPTLTTIQTITTEFYESNINIVKDTAVNGSRSVAWAAYLGTDATLGPLSVEMGGCPSATGSSRSGFVYVCDNSAIRPFWLNSNNGTSFGPTLAGAITAASLSLSGAIGVNGSTPPAKAADPGIATSSDAAVINAIVTILKNLGFCS